VIKSAFASTQNQLQQNGSAEKRQILSSLKQVIIAQHVTNNPVEQSFRLMEPQLKSQDRCATSPKV
jgi:hypothetical protein